MGYKKARERIRKWKRGGGGQVGGNKSREEVKENCVKWKKKKIERVGMKTKESNRERDYVSWWIWRNNEQNSNRQLKMNWKRIKIVIHLQLHEERAKER